MKHTIPNPETLSEDSRQLYDVLNEESDVACVLIGTSYLDQTLASLLERYFIESKITAKFLHPHGPLGSLNSRSELGYCLGLISKAFNNNVSHIAEIRNKFAHRHLLLTFETEEITTIIEKLTPPKVTYSFAIDENGRRQEWAGPFSDCRSPRDKFNFIVIMMVNSLLLSSLAMKHRPRKGEGWS